MKIESNTEGEMVIRNDEQVEMLGVLVSLKDACHAAKTDAFKAGEINESLHSAFRNVEWASLECVRAERWLDDAGAMGWRCYIDGPDKGNRKLQIVLRDTLIREGWDGAEVVPA